MKSHSRKCLKIKDGATDHEQNIPSIKIYKQEVRNNFVCYSFIPNKIRLLKISTQFVWGK